MPTAPFRVDFYALCHWNQGAEAGLEGVFGDFGTGGAGLYKSPERGSIEGVRIVDCMTSAFAVAK